MSGAWDGSLVLTCRGGPWAGQERVWQGADLEVPGHRAGRYVALPARQPHALVWVTRRERS